MARLERAGRLWKPGTQLAAVLWDFGLAVRVKKFNSHSGYGTSA